MSSDWTVNEGRGEGGRGEAGFAVDMGLGGEGVLSLHEGVGGNVVWEEGMVDGRSGYEGGDGDGHEWQCGGEGLEMGGGGGGCVVCARRVERLTRDRMCVWCKVLVLQEMVVGARQDIGKEAQEGREVLGEVWRARAEEVEGRMGRVEGKMDELGVGLRDLQDEIGRVAGRVGVLFDRAEEGRNILDELRQLRDELLAMVGRRGGAAQVSGVVEGVSEEGRVSGSGQDLREGVEEGELLAGDEEVEGAVVGGEELLDSSMEEGDVEGVGVGGGEQGGGWWCPAGGRGAGEVG